MTPARFKMMRMTAITSSVWTILPERGILGKTFGPKYPSSHRTSRITIIRVSMIFLLFSDQFPYFIIRLIGSRRIHQPGSAALRHLGEVMLGLKLESIGNYESCETPRRLPITKLSTKQQSVSQIYIDERTRLRIGTLEAAWMFL
jgi:hypothetical protein